MASMRSTRDTTLLRGSRRPGLRVEQAGVGERHVIGGHHVAGVELDPLAHVDQLCPLVRLLPRLGEIALELPPGLVEA